MAKLNNEARSIVVNTLALYGASLTDDNRIVRGDKVLGVEVSTSGRRLQFHEHVSGWHLASGPINGPSVHRFVQSFWYWTPISVPPAPSSLPAPKPAG